MKSIGVVLKIVRTKVIGDTLSLYQKLLRHLRFVSKVFRDTLGLCRKSRRLQNQMFCVRGGRRHKAIVKEAVGDTLGLFRRSERQFIVVLKVFGDIRVVLEVIGDTLEALSDIEGLMEVVEDI